MADRELTVAAARTRAGVFVYVWWEPIVSRPPALPALETCAAHALQPVRRRALTGLLLKLQTGVWNIDELVPVMVAPHAPLPCLPPRFLAHPGSCSPRPNTISVPLEATTPRVDPPTTHNPTTRTIADS